MIDLKVRLIPIYSLFKTVPQQVDIVQARDRQWYYLHGASTPTGRSVTQKSVLLAWPTLPCLSNQYCVTMSLLPNLPDLTHYNYALGRQFLWKNWNFYTVKDRFSHLLWRLVHPSPNVMADFFQTQKLTWCPHPICTIFGGCIKYIQVLIFCAKYIDFLH